jgi:copper chaperone CopZ
VEETVLSIPLLWADHHTLAVRGAILPIEGIEKLEVSALHHTATVAYDPAKTTSETIVAALSAAGYEVGDVTVDVPAGKVLAADAARAWAASGSRMTATNPVDLAMSGDHRKY